MRLQKFISNYSTISRRKAELLIKEGRVKVNGEIITEPYYEVSEKDKVVAGNKLIKPFKNHIYLAFNKPPEVVTSFFDPEGRKTIKDFLQKELVIKYAGRLDYYSEGLILLSSDGDFIEAATHPRYEIEKEYLLFSFKPIKKELIEKFIEGVYIEGILHKAEKIEILNEKGIKIILKQGKYREIRNICKVFNQPVARLLRVRIGNVLLGGLKPGKFRQLKRKEIDYFKKIKTKVDRLRGL